MNDRIDTNGRTVMVRTLVVLADRAGKPGLIDTLPPWGLLVGGLLLFVLGVVIYLVGQALGDDTGLSGIAAFWQRAGMFHI